MDIGNSSNLAFYDRKRKIPAVASVTKAGMIWDVWRAHLVMLVVKKLYDMLCSITILGVPYKPAEMYELHLHDVKHISSPNHNVSGQAIPSGLHVCVIKLGLCSIVTKQCGQACFRHC